MNNLKEINCNNCTCYYFDDIVKIEDFDFDFYHLVFNISNKTLIGTKPLSIRLDKANRFI